MVSAATGPQACPEIASPGNRRNVEVLGAEQGRESLAAKTQIMEQPECIVNLYRLLERRWKKRPLFLHRTLSYNRAQLPPLLTGTPPQEPPPHHPPPLQTNASNPPRTESNGNTHGSQAAHSNGVNGHSQSQEHWELEVTAHIWNPSNDHQRLAQIAEKVAGRRDCQQLPIFAGVSSPGPLTKEDSSLVFPVSSFCRGRVPVVQRVGKEEKLVLKLPGTGGDLPRGKLFCIIWDNPVDIQLLDQGPFLGSDTVLPLEGVPPSGKGTWCSAMLPTKEGQTPSSSGTVLRQSEMVCLSRDGYFGDQFVHVQAGSNLLNKEIFRMKMRLSRSNPLSPNLMKNGVSPLTNGRSSAKERVGFVLASGTTEQSKGIEIVSGLRCPFCWRHTRTFQAFQLHLLGVHGRFEYLVHQPGRHPLVFASVASFGETDEERLHPNTEYVFWSGDWSRPEAAFHALAASKTSERRKGSREKVSRDRPEAEIEGEPSAKRVPTDPSPPLPEPMGNQAEDLGGLAAAMPGRNHVGGTLGEPSAREFNGEESERNGGMSPGGVADGGEQGAGGGELAQCLEAAWSPDEPPFVAQESSRSQNGGTEFAPSSSAQEVGGMRGAGGAALMRGEYLNGNLEPHCLKEIPPADEQGFWGVPPPRSASVGPGSSTVESESGALPLVLRNREKEPVFGSGGGGEGVVATRGGGGKLTGSKKKGGSKAKRKPMDSDRNMENLTKRTFYHSRTGMPMGLENVLTAHDSEDDLDEMEMQQDDLRMLNDFTDVSRSEKQVMFMWNCFARQQRIAADAHMPWASRAFAHLHKTDIAPEPALRRVFMLMLIKFWNCALISADDVDECLKIVDSASLD